jgi:hypothetical protein
MGREYKIVESTRKEIDKAVCDRCDKIIGRHKELGEGHWNPCGEPYSNYFEPMLEEEFFVLNKSWGYFSGKDTEIHEAVLCESCYDIVFKDVKIKITNYM